MRTTARTCLAAATAVLLLAAAPAAAEVFHVELTNGNVFDTLYQPEEASWDSSLVLFMSDSGTWMAIPKQEIAGISSETENQGFGMVIDTTTILLGYSANDAPLPGEEQEFSEIERLQQFYQDQQQDYSVQQFVEPGQAGGATGGFPAEFARWPSNSTSVGGVPQPIPFPVGTVLAPPPTPAPAPVAPAPSGGLDQ